MPVQGIKSVASSRNGLGAFILQCKRLDFHYCDWAGSSTGMNKLLQSPLMTRFTSRFPATEFRISPRPHKHPVIKAYYINGKEKAVCVRNLDTSQILQKAELMIQNSGAKNKKIRGRNVVSTNESVRGIWSPMHGGLKNI